MAALLARCAAMLIAAWALAWGAHGAQPGAPAQGPVLEVFVREGCPHCARAKAFLPAFAREHPGLAIRLRDIDRDPAARDDLLRHFLAADAGPPGVPAFLFEGRLLVGFESAERTGPELAALVAGVPQPATEVESGLFGTLSVSRLGLPLFTLALGLLDGFNPCATWVLLFLLSLLVHLHDRGRLALIAGTFVMVSGAVYYAFMAAWLNVFLAVGFSTPLRLGLGALALAIGAINVKDFFSPGRGFSLSIRPSAKPGLYARMRGIVQGKTLPVSLAGVAVLALVVNFVELLCTAGLPAVYTAVLAQQGLPPAGYYGYLGLYIVGYMADDAVMVGLAVAALSSRKLTEDAGAWLKLLSGGVMLALGAILLLRPEWLV